MTNHPSNAGVRVMSDSPIDLPPDAHAAIQALANAPTTPAKLLVSGGIGTGKTTILAAARDTLRGAGLAVLARPPHAGDPPDPRAIAMAILASVTVSIADETSGMRSR